MKVMTVRSPGGLDNLEAVDRAAPEEPRSGEMRVRIHASSLNFHDKSVVTGTIPTEDGRIPMSDGAGVVEAVGEGVEEFTVGDAVVSTFFPPWLEGEPQQGNFSSVPGDGVDGYAREQVVRPTHWFTHAPQGYSHAEAATLTTAGLTAWRALTVDNRLKAGDTILVLGTGGVSLFALQFARLMGANVIATSSSDDKLERLRQMGATHTINYRDDPGWGKTVKKLTNGRGVDQIIEVGGPDTLVQSIDAIRIGGIISLIGVLTGTGGNIPTAKFMTKQARLQGLLVGNRRHQVDMVRAIESSDLRPVIDSRYKLDDMADAFRHEESGQHFGKICLEL